MDAANSLTSHLRDATSQVRQHLQHQFPCVRGIQAGARATLAGAPTLRPDKPVPWGTLGLAIDYRLRFYFAETPARELRAWFGAQEIATSTFGTDPFFSNLDAFVASIRPAGRRLARPHEEELLRYCTALALFEEVVRAPGVRPGSPLSHFQYAHLQEAEGHSACLEFPPGSRFLSPKGAFETTAQRLLEIAEPHWLDDLAALSWAFYDKFLGFLFQPAVTGPIFSTPGLLVSGDGDLVVGGCLIDIKTTTAPRVSTDWLYQILGYTLLDGEDRYHIRDVGFYLARQAVLLRWPVTDFLSALSGGSCHSLEEAREQFREAMRERQPSLSTSTI